VHEKKQYSWAVLSLSKGRGGGCMRAFEQNLPWAILATRAIHSHLDISQKNIFWINISKRSLHSHLSIFKHTSACFSLKPDPNHKYKQAMQCHGHPLGWCRASRKFITGIVVRRHTKYLIGKISENLKGPYLLRFSPTLTSTKPNLNPKLKTLNLNPTHKALYPWVLTLKSKA
jgi:hypothetical protein